MHCNVYQSLFLFSDALYHFCALFAVKLRVRRLSVFIFNTSYQNILSNECKKYVKVVIKHLIYKYTNAVKSETKHTICTLNTKKEEILPRNNSSLLSIV